MKAIKIKQFKARCSGINEVMANGRGKGTMGATCKSHLKKWLIQQVTGIKKDAWSKEMEKGVFCESDAIELAGQHYGWFMPQKNTKRRTNDFLTGEADVVLPKCIADIKCPWDVYTFPNFDSKIPVKGYEQQLQGYCELWDKPTGQLTYVLVDTPEELDPYNTCAQPEEGYDSWELHERIRSYTVERDVEFMEAVRDRVHECRVELQNEIIPELEEWKKIKIEIES